jgi:hypothetical protein
VSVFFIQIARETLSDKKDVFSLILGTCRMLMSVSSVQENVNDKLLALIDIVANGATYILLALFTTPYLYAHYQGLQRHKTFPPTLLSFFHLPLFSSR